MDEPAPTGRVYVSITGLRPLSLWHALRFWRHAIPSMAQALKTPGCLSATTRSINGVKHTLTVWESETAMKRFLYSGAHREAIRAFPNLATGLTYGFWTDRVPEWSEVHDLWKAHGRPYRTAPMAHASGTPTPPADLIS